MTYLLIVILVVMGLAGGMATVHHNYAGTPFLVIGVLGLAAVLWRRRGSERSPGTEGE